MDIKDSGKRKEFASGMVRDVTEGKIDYTLAFDGPMFERYAKHLTKGAVKYSKRNWMKAKGQEELDRFRESALRHFLQWCRGETDEDHAAAVFFNINRAEYVESQDILPGHKEKNHEKTCWQYMKIKHTGEEKWYIKNLNGDLVAANLPEAKAQAWVDILNEVFVLGKREKS